MPKQKASSGAFLVNEAIQNLHDMCIKNEDWIKKLKEQHDELLVNITKKQDELETRIGNMETQISDIYMKRTPSFDENQQNLNEIKRQSSEIIKTLFCLSEQSELNNITHTEKMTNNPTTSTVSVSNMGSDSDYSITTTPSRLKNNIQKLRPHSTMVPSRSAMPVFCGKYSENPKQFIIRVEEYAATVYGWDQAVLLRGMSQFLEGTALDWYCQLKAFHRCPQRWEEFVNIFLSQFNSPIRIARNKQKWYECKQLENETLNNFLVRLRAIWSEQRPKETESDLVKHFLSRMRSDLCMVLKISPGATLDEIMLEAQKVEEIMHFCKKQYEADYFKHTSSIGKDTSDRHENGDEDDDDNDNNSYCKSTQSSSIEK